MQLATGIVSAKPAVVIGPALVALCNAIAPLMRRGPVVYCLSPGIYPASGSFVFSISNATRDLAAAQLRYFRLRGLTRLALITSTDASGQDALRNVKELLAQPENKDLQLVAETTFNPTDVSASAQIERIKGAQPQALIAWSTGAAIGTVFKAILDAGLDIPVATTNGNMTYAQMRQYAGILPKVLYIPSSGWPRTEGAAGRGPRGRASEAALLRGLRGHRPSPTPPRPSRGTRRSSWSPRSTSSARTPRPSSSVPTSPSSRASPASPASTISRRCRSAASTIRASW